MLLTYLVLFNFHRFLLCLLAESKYLRFRLDLGVCGIFVLDACRDLLRKVFHGLEEFGLHVRLDGDLRKCGGRASPASDRLIKLVSSM